MYIYRSAPLKWYQQVATHMTLHHAACNTELDGTPYPDKRVHHDHACVGGVGSSLDRRARIHFCVPMTCSLRLVRAAAAQPPPPENAACSWFSTTLQVCV